MTRAFHADGELPGPDSVFVFGSNLSGIHGGGAALAAHDYFGAKWGVGEGLTGGSYALPTVRHNIAEPRSLDEIRASVSRFLACAEANPSTSFFVTRVGCGLAGHHDAEIAPMFASAPHNCSLPDTWRKFVDAGGVE